MFRELIEKWQGANPAEQIRKSWQGQRPDLLLRLLDRPSARWADDDFIGNIRRIPGLLENHVARLYTDGDAEEAALIKAHALQRYASLREDPRTPEPLRGVFADAHGSMEEHFASLQAPSAITLEQDFTHFRTTYGLNAAAAFIGRAHDDFGKSSRVRKQLASFAIEIAPALVEAGHAGVARRVLANACSWGQGTGYHAAAVAMVMAVFPDIAPRA